MNYLKVKRCLDLVFAFTGLVILSPLLLLISILIKLDSDGPILFIQNRIGLHGKVFRLYKFRSMYTGAKGSVYESKSDARVTRVGRIIRKTSMDELPQLMNIIKGDMSFIGPRPVLVQHPWPFEEYSDEQKKRFLVRPGISGWAQIHGRKNLDWNMRMRYDVEYISKCSFKMDIKIFFITIYKVLTMQDNYNKNHGGIHLSLELMYITNDERIAATAERCGVDWIFIDLEVNEKKERQGHLDTVISNHQIEDIKKIKSVIHKSKVLVRINPINPGTEEEIDKVIKEGADMIMLPYFKESKEAALFLEYVNQRTKTCLLCETAEAVNNIDEILKLPGIDYIYIGLNDLHLSYHMDFMFEPLADGTVDKLCDKFKKKGIPYGFGGIAGLGQGDLPSEYIIAEHYRLGSTMVILSRCFYNTACSTDPNKADEVFSLGIKKIREFENSLKSKDEDFFQKNHSVVKERVQEIVSNIKKNREKQ